MCLFSEASACASKLEFLIPCAEKQCIQEPEKSSVGDPGSHRYCGFLFCFPRAGEGGHKVDGKNWDRARDCGLGSGPRSVAVVRVIQPCTCAVDGWVTSARRKREALRVRTLWWPSQVVPITPREGPM